MDAFGRSRATTNMSWSVDVDPARSGLILMFSTSTAICDASRHGWILAEQIQRKSRVRERTPHNAPRIRAGVEKKDQKAELKKNQRRRRYVEKTSIFFQTTGRHPPGARRETTEVKTRKC